VLRALHEWDAVAAQGRVIVPLSRALQRAQRLARPGSRIVVLGDGFDCDAAAEPALSLLARHCDVSAVLLTDPLEHQAPPPARYALHSEQGGQVLLDFSAASTRARWTQLFEARRAHWLDMLRRRSLNATMLDTHAAPELAMRTVFGQTVRGRGAA
jgi:hypothetical protein